MTDARGHRGSNPTTRTPVRHAEYPAFVPVKGGWVGVTLTVPENRSRAVVLLTTGGGGAPRTHAGSMWTRLARELAVRDLASIRMDWRGVGDSTGEAHFPIGFANLPVEDLLAVASFARDATGAEAFGVAGNCGGARAALLAAPAIPGCGSLALMLIKAAAHIGSEGPMQMRARLLLSKAPAIERSARRLVRAARSVRPGPAVGHVRRASRSYHVLVLEDRTPSAGSLMRRLDGDAGIRDGRRLDVRELPVPWSRGFDSVDRQDYVVAELTRWFDETLPAR